MLKIKYQITGTVIDYSHDECFEEVQTKTKINEKGYAVINYQEKLPDDWTKRIIKYIKRNEIIGHNKDNIMIQIEEIPEEDYDLITDRNTKFCLALS